MENYGFEQQWRPKIKVERSRWNGGAFPEILWPEPLTKTLGLMKYVFVLTLSLGTTNMVNAALWDDPLDPIGITTEAVAKKRKPILRVVHDTGHGGWQFYDDAEPLKGPVVLPKVELLKLDASLSVIKDLPVGWEATRKNAKSPWVRSKIPQ